MIPSQREHCFAVKIPVSKDSISVTVFSIVGNSLLKSEPDVFLFL